MEHLLGMHLLPFMFLGFQYPTSRHPFWVRRKSQAKFIRNAQISYFCFGKCSAVLRSTQTIFSLRRRAWLPISRYWKQLTNGKSRKWAQMMSLSGILPSGKAYSMYHLCWHMAAITNNASHNVVPCIQDAPVFSFSFRSKFPLFLSCSYI